LGWRVDDVNTDCKRISQSKLAVICDIIHCTNPPPPRHLQHTVLLTYLLTILTLFVLNENRRHRQLELTVSRSQTVCSRACNNKRKQIVNTNFLFWVCFVCPNSYVVRYV